jgi:4-carboxymuconolactone decarboxylase
MTSQYQVPQSATNATADIALYMADLTQRVLFGEVWESPGLSKRDRSLITLSVLTALYRSGQIPGHVQRGLANGLTKEEIVAMMTHIAFYAGWPTAVNAIAIAKETFDKLDKA